jgi:hypothetical protein
MMRHKFIQAMSIVFRADAAIGNPNAFSIDILTVQSGMERLFFRTRSGE